MNVLFSFLYSERFFVPHSVTRVINVVSYFYNMTGLFIYMENVNTHSLTHSVGTSLYGVARSQVMDEGSASNMEVSCKYIEETVADCR
jgi:hypothetical protein